MKGWHNRNYNIKKNIKKIEENTIATKIMDIIKINMIMMNMKNRQQRIIEESTHKLGKNIREMPFIINSINNRAKTIKRVMKLIIKLMIKININKSNLIFNIIRVHMIIEMNTQYKINNKNLLIKEIRGMKETNIIKNKMVNKTIMINYWNKNMNIKLENQKKVTINMKNLIIIKNKIIFNNNK